MIINDNANGTRWWVEEAEPVYADVATTGDYEDLLNTPILSTVAVSGEYQDLHNTPTLSAVALTGDYEDLLNTPILSTVAITGIYDDLLNKPTLAIVAYTGNYNDLHNKPTFSLVAFTGSYEDLLNAPEGLWTTYTVGGIRHITNAIDAVLAFKGGGGLELATNFSTESSITSFDMNNNPRLVWRGYINPGGAVPDYYLTTRVVIDRDGRISFGNLKDLPEWFSSVNSMSISGVVLGALALAVAGWGIAGGAGGIINGVKGIFDKVKKAFGGEDDGGGGGGTTNSEEEAPAIEWRVIGSRPFFTSSVVSAAGSVLGGNIGFAGDLYVANQTPLLQGNAMYVVNYDKFSVGPVTGNVVLDTGVLVSEKTLLIDFKNRLFQAKNVQVEETIKFYNDNAGLFTTYTTVLELNSTTHGLWRFTKDGLFHGNNVVVSYNQTQNRYIFHGTMTDAEPTPASEVETGAPTESLVQTHPTALAPSHKPERNHTADPAGQQLRQIGSQQARQIQALNQRAAQLQQENKELLSQAVKQKRDATKAKAKNGLKAGWKALKTKTKAAKDSVTNAFSHPAETYAKIQGAADQAILRGKTLINVNKGKVVDAGFKLI